MASERRQVMQMVAGQVLLALAGRAVGAEPAPQADTRQRPKGGILLSVTGAIARGNAGDGARRYDFDAEMIDALPVHVVRTSTPWHKGVVAFSGPRLGDVLNLVGASGSTLAMTALNDYQIRIPADEALADQPILARRMDGTVLGVRDKGPLFMVFPFDDRPANRNHTLYSWAVWQLRTIEVR